MIQNKEIKRGNGVAIGSISPFEGGEVQHNSCEDRRAQLLTRSVAWLRGEGAEKVVGRKILAYLLAGFLALSIVGIPLLIKGISEWKRQVRLLPSRIPTFQDFACNPKNNAQPQTQVVCNEAKRASSLSVITPRLTQRKSKLPPVSRNLTAPSHPLGEDHTQLGFKKIIFDKTKKRLHGQEILAEHDRLLAAKPGLPPLIRKPPAWDSSDFPEGPEPWKTMWGVALMADYLMTKHNRNDLFVCETLLAFQKKLEEIDKGPNTRVVLIVPTHRAALTCNQKRVENCRKSQHRSPDYHAQHKMAVFVEKTDGKIDICIMDGYRPIIRKGGAETHDDFSCHEIIYAYLKAAKLKKARLYFDDVRRQTGDGCSTFALRDAIGFLKMENFFERIQNDVTASGTEKHPFFLIKTLPPEFMRRAQSLKTIHAYERRMQRKKRESDLKEQLGRERREFRESVDKHARAILVRDKKTGALVTKERNMFISDRVNKYQNIIVQLMRRRSVKEIWKRIYRRLIVA